MGFKERLRQRKEKIQEHVKRVWQRTRRYVKFGVYIDRSTPPPASHGRDTSHDSHHSGTSHGEKHHLEGHAEQTRPEHQEVAHEIPEYVAEYKFLKQHVQGLQNPIRISYPACGYDISLSKVFTDSETYYLDTNPDVIAKLQEAKNQGKLNAGAHIMSNSGLAFTPIAVDMVVLHNASISGTTDRKQDSTKMLKTLKPGGLAVVSNWHGPTEAKYLLQMPDMELQGRFVHRNQQVEFDQSDLPGLKAQLQHASDLDGGGLKNATFVFQKIPQEVRIALPRAA